MNPFQPVEVRGFSKYTRITTWNVSRTLSASWHNRRA